jgi:hypothetical protein
MITEFLPAEKNSTYGWVYPLKVKDGRIIYWG